MSSPRNPALRLTITAVIGAILFLAFMRGCGRRTPTSLPASSSPSTESGTTNEQAPISPQADPAPTVQATAPPSSTSATTGMLALTLQFQNGLLNIANRKVLPNAATRPLRQVVGMLGLYHRIVNVEGSLLFENVVPDPRQVFWDTSDDGKKLRGGVALSNELPVLLRLPAGVHGRLQVFEMKETGWTRPTLETDGQLIGDFEL